MKAGGLRLDGAATSAGTRTEEGRALRQGGCFIRASAEGGWWAGSKNKPRHPGARGSGELGEDHHSQQLHLAE